MSQELIFKIKCANLKCTKELTAFEINRQKNHIARYHFCMNCRKYQYNITHINCRRCHRVIIFSGKNTTCPECVQAQKAKLQKNARKGIYARKGKCKVCGTQLGKYKHLYCSYACMNKQNYHSEERKAKLKERYL